VPYTPLQILTGLVLPAVIVGLGLALAWRPWRGRAGADVRWISAPLAAGGFAIAYWNFEPKAGWPPTANIIYLLLYFAAPIAVLGMADALLKPPLWLRTYLLMLLWWLAVSLLLRPLMNQPNHGFAPEMWIDAMSLITVMWWLTFERLAEHSPGVTAPLLLALFSCGGAVLLALGWHIQSSATMAASLMGMSIAAAVLGACSSRVSFSRGFAQTIVLLLQLVLIHGYFYTDDALTARQELWAALFAMAPLLAFIGDLPLLRRRPPAARLAARVLPLVILLGIICALTVRDYVHAEQSQSAMQDE
jgi:hypothetical protein